MTFTKGHKINNGRKRSVESRKRYSLSKIGSKNPMYGICGEKNPASRPEVREKIRQKTIQQFKNGMPEETKRKLSIIHTGMKHSEETKEKIRLNHSHYVSPETAKKIVATRRKNNSYYHTEETKKIIREKRMEQIIPLQDTSIEKKLQQELLRRKIKFETHKSIFGQPDIFIKPNICIFADGDYWHNTQKAKKRDKEVNNVLSNNGYKILRFWEHQINTNVEKCITEIKKLNGEKNEKTNNKNIKCIY